MEVFGRAFAAKFAAYNAHSDTMPRVLTPLENQHLKSAHTDNDRYYHAVKNKLIVGVPEPVNPATDKAKHGARKCICCPFGIQRRRDCKERQQQLKYGPAALLQLAEQPMWSRGDDRELGRQLYWLVH